MRIRIRIRLLIFMDTDPKIIYRRFASCLVLFQRVVHCQKSNPNFRDITLNVEGNMILNEIFRVVLRFPRYISCYIAESRFPLGQCNKFANHMVCFNTMQKKKICFQLLNLFERRNARTVRSHTSGGKSKTHPTLSPGGQPPPPLLAVTLPTLPGSQPNPFPLLGVYLQPPPPC